MDYFFGFKSVISGSQPEAEPSPADTVNILFTQVPIELTVCRRPSNYRQ